MIEWDCNLDYDFMQNCRPKYKFRRLDNPNSKIAPGWNFRHSQVSGRGLIDAKNSGVFLGMPCIYFPVIFFFQYFYNGARTLYKSYGLLFQLEVQGRAGKFSFIPFAINLGAGLALLSIATVVCDVIVLYCMKDRVVYREKKYLQVRGSDAYNVYRNSDPSSGEDEGLQEEEEGEEGDGDGGGGDGDGYALVGEDRRR